MRNPSTVFVPRQWIRSLAFLAPLLSVVILVAVVAEEASAQKPGAIKQPPAVNHQKAIITGGNQIYEIFIEDDPASGSCGTWTATTGPLHPAGGGQNILYGQGFPSTSNTSLRSYTSGIDYSTGTSSGSCVGLCGAVAPVTQAIRKGLTIVGYRLTWSFVDGVSSLELIQEVVVEGPVNGTQTVNNTVIRETHIVRNLGPGDLSFGLRKQWDWQIGADDGPWFGEDCGTPEIACDRSMNLTADGTLDGFYPAAYVINEDPATAGCPPGVTPGSSGCGGNPLYLVAGTVASPSSLNPPPDAPEVLQFNSWPSLFGTCWQPGLVDNATCGGGDTAAAYFYGLTSATAESLDPGEEKSFTQYVAAGVNSCPTTVDPERCPDGTPIIAVHTGQDANGDGFDDQWMVREQAATSFVPAPIRQPFPGWRGSQNPANTGPFNTGKPEPILGDGQWITTASGSVVDATYQLTFTIDCQHPVLSAETGVDDRYDLFLNGHLVDHFPLVIQAPYLSNSQGVNHPNANPIDGLIHPSTSSGGHNFRQIHPIIVDDPALFNLGGLNTLTVEVDDTGDVVTGLLFTGGPGTSLLSGATVRCCPPARDPASIPRLFRDGFESGDTSAWSSATP